MHVVTEVSQFCLKRLYLAQYFIDLAPCCRV